jgi:hypothetical protein
VDLSIKIIANDTQLVGEWGKCPKCGHRENKKKKKG